MSNESNASEMEDQIRTCTSNNRGEERWVNFAQSLGLLLSLLSLLLLLLEVLLPVSL